MRKHVSLLCSIFLLKLCFTVKAGPPKGVSFGDFKTWLDTAPQEEQNEYFHSLSEGYIKQHGEKANEIRLCLNIDHGDWMGVANWVDQKWATVGVRYLVNQRYTDWIVNAK